MLEKDVEKYLNKKIKDLGGISLKFTSPNKNGVPDRMILINGICKFVELKKPGEKPRPLQVKTHKEFADAGFPVTTIDTIEKVNEFITTLTDN